uniref:Ig-like domain-containing protein n=1 Tax=Poecilia reticulata TaxID=8081 RepID=A0A3P9QI26_POERE
VSRQFKCIFWSVDLGFLLNTIQLNFHLVLFLIAESETSMSCVLNENCLLPCRFKNGTTYMEWKNYNPQSQIVSYDHRGSRYSESFRSRASLFEDQISRGNGDLLLRGVKIDDEGRYVCIGKINGIKIFLTVLHFLILFAAPESTVRIHQDENMITCSSEGIYPEPELTWSTEPPSNTTLQNRTTVHQTEENFTKLSALHVLEVILIFGDISVMCFIFCPAGGAATHILYILPAKLSQNFINKMFIFVENCFFLIIC